MSISKKIWIPLLILMTILVLRESGCVIFHYANSQFDNQMQIKLRSDFNVNKDGKQLPASEEKKIDSQQPIIAVMSWNLGFNTTPQATVLTSIEEQVQATLKGKGSLNVKFHNTELIGFYWLPLYKSGTCQYLFDVEIVGENSKVYRGTGNGEIEFLSFGIISATEVKEKLSEQIAADLVSTLKRETK